MSTIMKKTWTTLQGYRERRRESFQSTAIQPWEPSSVIPGPGYFEATRERPARPLNIESDFLTPLLQSLVVVFFCFLSSLYVIWYFSRMVWHLSCFVSILAGGLFFLFSVVLNRKLLWIAETITQEDLDNSGEIGKPRELDPLEVVLRDEQGRFKRQYNLETGIDDRRIIQFAQSVLNGKSLAEGNWIGSQGIFSKSEYNQLISELERAGLVTWKGAKNQGRELTQVGIEAFRRLIDG